jgi:hypothetical protein
MNPKIAKVIMIEMKFSVNLIGNCGIKKQMSPVITVVITQNTKPFP